MNDGYTKFPNDLLIKIMSFDLNLTQVLILLYVIRNTYGWNKESCEVSIAVVAAATGKHKNGISREIERLISRNILCVKCAATHRKARVVCVNKDFSSWCHSSVCHSQLLQSQLDVTHVDVTPVSQPDVTPVSQPDVTPVSQPDVTHIKKELNKGSTDLKENYIFPPEGDTEEERDEYAYLNYSDEDYERYKNLKNK